MTITAGTQPGSYDVLGQIGAGGMGDVNRATTPNLIVGDGWSGLRFFLLSTHGRTTRDREIRTANAQDGVEVPVLAAGEGGSFPAFEHIAYDQCPQSDY
jgi:hypothetical protein